MNTNRSLLDITLAAARRDEQLAKADGQSVRQLIQDVSVRPLTVHVDSRGSLMEMFDPRWQWHNDPIVFLYTMTIRPGYTKGWNLHREHEDRYILLQGEMEVVLFDPRPESSTCGAVCRIVLSERAPAMMNVPRNVWHADRNIGSKDVVVVNLPTTPYDHEHPDKYRLPLDTDLIPFSFGSAQGW